MSPCRNIHGNEKSLCQKLPVPKSPCTKMSMCQNTYRAETCTCQNVLVIKCLCRNVRWRNGGKPSVWSPKDF
jgi:hypothetical protein